MRSNLKQELRTHPDQPISRLTDESIAALFSLARVLEKIHDRLVSEGKITEDGEPIIPMYAQHTEKEKR